MQIDVLIVGQGVSGTFLSYYLMKEGCSVLVIDNNDVNAPSRISAGVINPITGRRMVKVWMADEILPFAWNAYEEIGRKLNITAISQRNIIDFFPNPFMKENFLKRRMENEKFLHEKHNKEDLNDVFRFEFGYGEISPVYIAHLGLLLPAWRKELKNKNALLEEDFLFDSFTSLPDGVSYKGIKAKSLIFCDGIGSFNHPLFHKLPFAPNKGESLLVRIPNVSKAHVYKKNMLLVPMSEEEIFWVGSSYQWEFRDTNPSKEFREKTEWQLKEWLKVPFVIEEQLAAVRPATIERRPFVGMHPVTPAVGILNGMGTKGCSLAPYFALQLSNHLLHGNEIANEASIRRFKGLLTKR